MDKEYKITLSDKRKKILGMGFLIFFSVVFILNILSVFDQVMHRNKIPIMQIISIILLGILIISFLFKYNYEEFSYYIINKKCITHKTFLRNTIKEIYWDDVKEVGIGKSILFDVITKSIYVTSMTLTEKDRYKFIMYGFELSDDIFHMKYTEEAYNAIKEFYSGKILINTDEDN